MDATPAAGGDYLHVLGQCPLGMIFSGLNLSIIQEALLGAVGQ